MGGGGGGGREFERTPSGSASENTVGILTLYWKETCYKDITTEIQNTIATLRQKGTKVDISWTHVSIAGRRYS